MNEYYVLEIALWVYILSSKITFKICISYRELFKDKKDYTITEAYIQQSVSQGLKQLFGEVSLENVMIWNFTLIWFLQVGASYPIEVESLSKTPYGASFILKCPALCYIKLRSSLTLQRTYHSDICVFHILRVGTNLLELYNSRPVLTIN